MFYRYRRIQIMFFFLCEFWQGVSFKELVHFILVIKFVDNEIFIVFLYYPFNVYKICSDVPSFIFGVNNCVLSFPS